MPSVRLPVAFFFCACLTWTSALPKRFGSNGVSSGAGELLDLPSPDYYPFDGPLGKGYPDNEVVNDYDFDPAAGSRIPPDFDVNNIPSARPQDGGFERPVKPVNRIPEEKHPEDEPKEEPEEEEDREPASDEKLRGDEETHDDEERKTEGEEKTTHEFEDEDTHAVADEKTPHESKEEDTHAVEDENKPHESGEDTHAVEDENTPHESEEGTHSVEDQKPHEGEEEETQDAEEEIPPPLKPAIFSFEQVNHYIKQLEKAMENAFQETLEDASLQNNTFANTTEEEVEINGHKYKVHKSIVETRDEDKNSTLFIEAISSVNEDEPKNNKSKRSNPDAEPNQ